VLAARGMYPNNEAASYSRLLISLRKGKKYNFVSPALKKRTGWLLHMASLDSVEGKASSCLFFFSRFIFLLERFSSTSWLGYP
jgi:hypothetical protein